MINQSKFVLIKTIVLTFILIIILIVTLIYIYKLYTKSVNLHFFQNSLGWKTFLKINGCEFNVFRQFHLSYFMT